MDGEQEFAHDRADSLKLLEAAGVDKMAVEGPDIGVMASGAESGHIEGDPQVLDRGVARAGAGRVLARIEAGMAPHCLARMSSGRCQGVKGMRWANGANTAASTASVLVRVYMASAKRWAALGLITMRASPASSRARAR